MNVLKLALAAAATLTILIAPVAFAQGHDPVTICHKPGTPAEHTITIDDSALVQAHLRHGDTLGPCETIVDPPLASDPPASDPVDEPTGVEPPAAVGTPPPTDVDSEGLASLDTRSGLAILFIAIAAIATGAVVVTRKPRDE